MASKDPMRELAEIMDDMAANVADTARMRALGLVLADMQNRRPPGVGLPVRDGERRVIGTRHEVDGVEIITLASESP